jgi:hypothetical protein
VGGAGIYQLIATTSAGCSDTATVTVTNNILLCPGNPVPIPEQIVISPNPVKDNLSVKVVRAADSKVGITIHNAAGQIVYIYSPASSQPAGQTIYNIPMKKMGGGVYVVTVWVNDKKEKVKKVMVK